MTKTFETHLNTTTHGLYASVRCLPFHRVSVRVYASLFCFLVHLKSRRVIDSPIWVCFVSFNLKDHTLYDFSKWFCSIIL